MAWNESGLTHVLIRLRTPGGETYETQARLACIASQRRQDPIAIDGDLSDWPVGAWNVAADFRSITGGSANATRLAPDRTANRTRAFILHDDAFLYIAFHCATDSPPKAARSHRNTVRYEDMIPVGEDLVEILIDPTNAGTHAAEDLYHIVIKRGAALFERGIATDPPIGPRSIWSADIRYATRASNDTWVIELRIPRDAFGEDHSGLRIWGINFARYDASRREYRNWSGAVHNAYDPLSLGNLMLP